MNSSSPVRCNSSSEYVNKLPCTPCLASCRLSVCPQAASIRSFSYQHLLLYIEAVCMQGNQRKGRALNAHRFLSRFLSHVPYFLPFFFSCFFCVPPVFASFPFLSISPCSFPVLCDPYQAALLLPCGCITGLAERISLSCSNAGMEKYKGRAERESEMELILILVN